MKGLLICVVAASLLIASCDAPGAKAELTPEEKLAGNYVGSLDIPQEMIDMALSFAKAGGADPKTLEEMEAEIKNADFRLDLRADGTCTMTTVSEGESDAADGGRPGHCGVLRVSGGALWEVHHGGGAHRGRGAAALGRSLAHRPP